MSLIHLGEVYISGRNRQAVWGALMKTIKELELESEKCKCIEPQYCWCELQKERIEALKEVVKLIDKRIKNLNHFIDMNLKQSKKMKKQREIALKNQIIVLQELKAKIEGKE